ncbi:response regulator [bacterium]|nr:response regulator [bacterium]
MEKEQKKILIVDDDKFLLDMYATKFIESGFAVTTAFGGMDALTKLEEGLRPDIILTDIVMPVMDGFEFLTELRNKKLSLLAHIVILSNLGQKEDIEKGSELGVSGYIVKATATPTEVMERVVEIVGENNPVESL